MSSHPTHRSLRELGRVQKRDRLRMHLDLGAKLSRTPNNAPSKKSGPCKWKYLEEFAHGIALHESQLLTVEQHFRSRLKQGLTATRTLTLKCYQLGVSIETTPRSPVAHSLSTKAQWQISCDSFDLGKLSRKLPACIGTGSIPPTYDFARRSGNNTRW